MDERAIDNADSDTLIGKAHAALKNNIISGHHQPGEKLRVEHLKRQYGVGSSTLREALTMLIADQLVIAEGQRGFRVKPVSIRDLIDLNRVRIVLEKEAIRQSITHGDLEWEEKIVSSFHLLTRAEKALTKDPGNKQLFDEWERWHTSFHLALFSADPSEWMQRFLMIAYQQCERYRNIFHLLAQDLARDDRRRDIEREHREIFDTVLSKDADQASQLLEKHLLRTLDEWVEFFENTDAFDADPATPVITRKPAPGKRKSR